jgi:hypothetical protein
VSLDRSQGLVFNQTIYRDREVVSVFVALPVNENNPAPIMAPTPKATRDLADKVLLALSLLLTSFNKTESGFVFQIDIYLVNLVLIVRKYIIYFRLNKYYLI